MRMRVMCEDRARGTCNNTSDNFFYFYRRWKEYVGRPEKDCYNN